VSEAHPDLMCRKVAEVVTEYLDGQLEAAERAQLEQHLLICQACVDFVAQNRLTVAGLRALSVQPLPAAARADVLAAFRKRKVQAP
jgi:anti-sigma factor RsiW